MAKDIDAIENIDEQLKKLREEKMSEKRLEKPITKQICRGKHEHIGKHECLDYTKEFSKIEKTDTKLFEVGEVKDEAIIAEETKELKKISSNDSNINETVIIPKKEEKLSEENENTEIADDEMSNTFVDEKFRFPKNKMKKEKKIIILLVVCLIILSSLAISIFLITNKKKEKSVVEEKELTEKQKKKIINNYGEKLEAIISDELEKNSVLLEYDDAIKLVKTTEKINCHEHEIYEDGSLYLNKCSINGIMTRYSYGELKEVLNNKLKVYVETSSGKATLNKPSASKEALYNVYEVDCGDNYSEVYLFEDYVVYYDGSGLVQMKNFKKDEKVLSNVNYKEVIPIKLSNGNFDTNYVAVLVNNFFGIYKLTGEQIISPMYSEILTDINKNNTKRNYIKVIQNNLIAVSDGSKYGVIDCLTNKTIVPLEFKNIILNGDYILATSETTAGRVFDLTGKEYLAGHNICANAENEYFLINENDSIKLVLIDGNSLYDYGIINNIGKFYSSKVAEEKVTFQFLDTKTNGKCIELVYDISDNSGEYTSNKMCGIN